MSIDLQVNAIHPAPTKMFGAIVGDVAGSTYERWNCKHEMCHIFAEGSHYTDDTVLTLATADKLVTGGTYGAAYRRWGRDYPNAGYGASFRSWLRSDAPPQPYNSWGNGSAMRVSPIAWAAPDLCWALEQAAESAEVTHNHPEGIKGAQAVVAAVFLARQRADKDAIRQYVESRFGYDLDRTVDSIRPYYGFDVSCQGSVPEAIIAFLESEDFESSIRKAISLGGDSDTIASITGAIAQAFYGGIPLWMEKYCQNALNPIQQSVISAFWERFPKNLVHEDGIEPPTDRV